MALERLSAFVQGDGILKLHLALLQPGDDGLQFAQRRLETEAGNVGRWAWRGDGAAPDAGGNCTADIDPAGDGRKGLRRAHRTVSGALHHQSDM
jgi:hypothetical protein